MFCDKLQVVRMVGHVDAKSSVEYAHLFNQPCNSVIALSSPETVTLDGLFTQAISTRPRNATKSGRSVSGDVPTASIPPFISG